MGSHSKPLTRRDRFEEFMDLAADYNADGIRESNEGELGRYLIVEYDDGAYGGSREAIIWMQTAETLEDAEQSLNASGTDGVGERAVIDLDTGTEYSVSTRYTIGRSDVCIAGNPAQDGQCGDDDCVCS